MTGLDAPTDHPDAAFFTIPFEIRRPQPQTLPVVFDSPHSGRRYPPSLLARTPLDDRAIRRSEDCFVEAVFSGVLAHGAPLLLAHFPRVYLDVNREPYELDPAMFEDRLPAYCNTQSERVLSGLGTIARVVADGSPIYREKLAFREAAWRVQTLHDPYHGALRGLIQETRARFGQAVLVDCHSMPSCGPGAQAARSRADIVLGDRFGQACHPDIIAAAEQFLKTRGYRVIRNMPYAGGYICTAYGHPTEGVHAMQIELNRALYMNEERLEVHSGFARVAADMAALASFIPSALSAGPFPIRDGEALAAE